MTTDLSFVLQWWVTLVAFGFVGWPVTRKLFSTWENHGYLLAKAVGIMLVTYAVWIAGSFRLAQYSQPAIIVAGLVIGGIGWKKLKSREIKWRRVIAEECFFLAALLFWTWIKAHEPSISGLEKFMDYGFAQSILRTDYFPPADTWFAGESINYYYYGHLVMTTLAKLSGVSLTYGFNLMLSTLFALCLTMSFAIGRHLLKGTGRLIGNAGAILISYLVTMSGNLHTIYAFTKGYWLTEDADTPPAFWTMWSKITDFQTVKDGWNNYWYPNATRFIPWTIHEFPAYSFVVSDIHGHVLSIPIVLLLIALLIQIMSGEDKKSAIREYVAYGMLAGMVFMTNVLDGPIYMTLLAILLVIKLVPLKLITKPGDELWQHAQKLIHPMGITLGVFALTIAPFLVHFKPFVSGVAVNCPPLALAQSKVGPIIFETVDKCQKSPIWMMLVLWGFFLYGGIGIYKFINRKSHTTGIENLLKGWSFAAAGLILFAEFFYFKDIYPNHFRSNTMFKLGYQAFIIMSIATGYSIVKMALEKHKTIIHKLYLGLAIPLTILVSIYPYFAVRSYFNQLKEYKSVWGMQWLADKYPGDLEVINWINKNIKDQPVIVEAAGDSYTDYERISTFTGLPTIAGWAVHEWLWRGGYDPIAKRAGEVALIYESEDVSETKLLLDKYNVRYVIIGDLERDKYPSINEDKLRSLGREVFYSGNTSILEL